MSAASENGAVLFNLEKHVYPVKAVDLRLKIRKNIKNEKKLRRRLTQIFWRR